MKRKPGETREADPIPRIKIIEDGKVKTLQIRVTSISNGWLVKPGGGTFYAPGLADVRRMVNECLDQLESRVGEFERSLDGEQKEKKNGY